MFSRLEQSGTVSDFRTYLTLSGRFDYIRSACSVERRMVCACFFVLFPKTHKIIEDILPKVIVVLVVAVRYLKEPIISINPQTSQNHYTSLQCFSSFNSLYSGITTYGVGKASRRNDFIMCYTMQHYHHQHTTNHFVAEKTYCKERCSL